jgi:hypothetical protein
MRLQRPQLGDEVIREGVKLLAPFPSSHATTV